MSTSASGGYLHPLNGVLTEEAIHDVWHDVVCGVTRMAPELVRPRWQEKPPASPPKGADWCAVGVISFGRDGHSDVLHNPQGDGTDIVRTQERVEILASFYGPHAPDYARLLRDGLYVAQNRDELRRAGFGLEWVGDPVAAPELVNGLWRKRSDLTVTAMLEIARAYAVRNCKGCLTFIETDSVPGGSTSGHLPLGVTACGRRK